MQRDPGGQAQLGEQQAHENADENSGIQTSTPKTQRAVADPEQMVKMAVAVGMMRTPKEAPSSRIANRISGWDPASHDFSRNTITMADLARPRHDRVVV